MCGVGFQFGDRLTGLADVNSFSIVPNTCSQSTAEVSNETTCFYYRFAFSFRRSLVIGTVLQMHCIVCVLYGYQGEIDSTRFVVLRRNTVRSNGGFMLNGGSDIILEHNSVYEFEAGFSAAPVTRGGNYLEQPLSSPPPFAVANATGAEGCPPWGCNQWCRGAQGVVVRGNWHA